MTATQQLTKTDLIESKLDRGIAGKLSISLRDGGTSFENMAEVLEFAKLMSISRQAVPPHCREQPGVCLGITIQAVEWRMSPFAVANKSYVVNDRLGYESQLIHAIVEQRAPIMGRLRHEFSGEGKGRKCRVWALDRKSGEELSYESPEFDTIQPKNSPLWKTKPDLQLYYNTSRDWARVYFPDVILGVYSSDELLDAAPMQSRSNGKTVEAVKQIERTPVISEEQRVALVELAQNNGVVEKLGEIVNAAGFEMVAHITADKYEDVVAAIEFLGKTADEAQPDYVEPGIHEPPVDEEPADELEKLRANVQTALDGLPKPARNNVMAGRSYFIKDADEEQLRDVLKTVNEYQA